MQTEKKRTSVDVGDGPFIAVSFPVQGTHLPADHGHALYAAITRHVPALHEVSWLGIELISGIPWDRGMIALSARDAKLHLRLPAQHYDEVLPLAGKRLEIVGYSIRLGIPLACPIVPATSLYARIVTIKKFTEPESFLAAACRQLDMLGISAILELPIDEGTRFRRIVSIHGKKIVGFSLIAQSLSDHDSIILQSYGLGGRRTMGCGLFNPIVRTLHG